MKKPKTRGPIAHVVNLVCCWILGATEFRNTAERPWSNPDSQERRTYDRGRDFMRRITQWRGPDAL